jgi:hypothetical protein
VVGLPLLYYDEKVSNLLGGLKNANPGESGV